MTPCEVCSGEIPPARQRRHAVTCSVPCQQERDRWRKKLREREAQAARVAARGRRPCARCGRLMPRERHGLATTCEGGCSAPPVAGSRLCSRQRCSAPTTADAPICRRHLVRFDREPIVLPPPRRRATYDELVHATYAGLSIAAQAAETRSEAQVVAARRRARDWMRAQKEATT